MNDCEKLAEAVRVARSRLGGQVTPLKAGQIVSLLIGPPHPIWDAGGAHGVLSAFYAAADLADRVYFLSEQVEAWHPSVKEQRRADLNSAEAQAAPAVRAACRALVDHAIAGDPALGG